MGEIWTRSTFQKCCQDKGIWEKDSLGAHFQNFGIKCNHHRWWCITVLIESSHSRILAALSFQSQAGLGLGRTFCLKNCVCICFKNSGGILTFQIFGLVWAPMVGRFELWWLSRGFTSTPPSAATGVGFIAISFRSQVSFGRYYETNCNYPGRYPDHPILFLPD